MTPTTLSGPSSVESRSPPLQRWRKKKRDQRTQVFICDRYSVRGQFQLALISRLAKILHLPASCDLVFPDSNGFRVLSWGVLPWLRWSWLPRIQRGLPLIRPIPHRPHVSSYTAGPNRHAAHAIRNRVGHPRRFVPISNNILSVNPASPRVSEDGYSLVTQPSGIHPVQPQVSHAAVSNVAVLKDRD